MDSDNFAVWDTAYVNTLPNSAFAYVDPKYGKESEDKALRLFPHHNATVKSASDNKSVDLAHLRNALARLPQANISAAAKKKVLNHLRAHANVLLKKVKRDGDSEFSESETFLAEVAEETEMLLSEMDGSDFVDSPVANLVTLPAEKIFKVGKWQSGKQSKEWSKEDLTDIADNHSKALDWFVPPLKDGHDDVAHALMYGEANIGTVENVRFEDPYLVADFKVDGAFFKNVIEPNKMPHKSAEIFQNVEKGGVTYKNLLKAVALLGISTPAVSGLNRTGSNYLPPASDSPEASQIDEEFTYSEFVDGNVMTFRFINSEQEGENVSDVKVTENKENEMTTKKDDVTVSVEQFTMLKAMLDDQAAKLELVTKEKADLAKKFGEATEVAMKYEASIKQFANEARIRENEVTIDTLVRAGKITPALKPEALAIFDALQTGNKVHKFGEVEKNSVELFKSFLESLPVAWNGEEKTKDVSTKEVPVPDGETEQFMMMGSTRLPMEGIELDAKAKLLQAEALKVGKVLTYGDALVEASRS